MTINNTMIDITQFTKEQLEHKQTFKDNQDELLWLVNTEAVRHLLSIKETEPIIEVFPNGFKQYLGTWDKNHHFQYEFRCYEVVAKHLLPYLTYENVLRTDYPLYQPRGLTEKYKCFLNYKNLERYSFPQIFMADTDYFAGAGDGDVLGPVNATWSTTRDGATGDTATYTTSPAFLRAGITASTYKIRRAYFPTDTSGIADGDTIDATTLNLFGTTDSNIDTDTTAYHAVQTSQADTASLVTSDYDNLTFTSGGSIAASSWSTSAYNAITLNATGLTWISKTTFTKIGAINSRDLDNSAPTGDNAQSCATSEATGTANDPKLIVTTSTPATEGGIPFIGY